MEEIMASISLCMIVKNEERVLKRCLDSICDLVDEIVIVDTGSTDSTKEIASAYTNHIYDFEWVDDFSAARNFSFSKCSMDYIYVADADEYLDDNNRLQFKLLKDNLFPEIEIVQMMYETVSNDTVLNVFREYRPKLFKRLREFTWINPVHEVVRLDPVVFDSDIIVTHAPEGNHAKRDFSIFEKEISAGYFLSDDLIKMYACELYKNGTLEDFEKASSYFEPISDLDNLRNYDGEIAFSTKDYYSLIISSKYLRLKGDEGFEAYALGVNELFENTNSEICYELGEYYLDLEEYDKSIRFFNIARNAHSALDVHSSGDYAIKKLITCCEKVISKYENYKTLNDSDEKMEALCSEYNSLIEKYKIELSEWKLPEEAAP